MNFLEEVIGALGVATLALAIWGMGACQEHYRHLPQSEWPRLERGSE